MEINGKSVASETPGGAGGPPLMGSAFVLLEDGCAGECSLEGLSTTGAVLAGPVNLRAGTAVKLILKLPGARLMSVHAVIGAALGASGPRGRQFRVDFKQPPQHTTSLLQAMVQEALDREPVAGAARPVPPARPGRA